MNENDKDLRQEPQQEQGIATEHSPTEQISKPSETGEGKGFVSESVSSDFLKTAKLETTEPMAEETGMDKPKDFSPVPPPRIVDKHYSVMPPPVLANLNITPAEGSEEELAVVVQEPAVVEQEPTSVHNLPEQPRPEPKMDTIVLEEPVTMASPPLFKEPVEEMGVEAPRTEEDGFYAGYSSNQERPQEPTAPTERVQSGAEQSAYFNDTPNRLGWEERAAPQQGQLPRRPMAPPPPQTEWSEKPKSQGKPLQPYQGYSDFQQQQNQSREYQWDYASYENYYKKPQKKKNRGIAVFIATLVITLVIGVVGLGAAGYISDRNQPDYMIPDGKTPPASSGETPTGEPDTQLSLNITQTPDRSLEELPPAGELLTVPQVAKKVTPSVVGIMKYSDRNLYQATGLGSGIILSVSEEGDAYIISNAHVVEQGTNFMVRVSDGTSFDAILVGEDVRSDLAVLKITAAELGDYIPIPAELGMSENTQVGEIAIAIGNPVNFDLSGSVTQGIVSAINRKIQTDTANMTYLQTDAAINPGNSGGALANAYGQVIGINTMKVNAVGFEGIGFAIPISDAIPVLNELIAFGTVTNRAMLGITAKAVPETQEGSTIIPAGIMVEEVSPLAKFNPEIQQYDIITHCNGERVYFSTDLHAITDGYSAGETIELTVYRKTSTVTTETILITVELISSADFG